MISKSKYYLNKGYLNRIQQLLHILFPDFIEKIAAPGQMNETSGVSVTVRKTIQVTPIAQLDICSQTIRNYLHSQNHPAILAFLAHGSVGTQELCSYSDYDGIILIDEQKLNGKSGIVHLRRIIKTCNQFLFQQDALQHHGIEVLFKQELDHYPDDQFPYAILERSAVVYPEKEITLDIAFDPDSLDYRLPFDKLCKAIKHKISSPHTLGSFYHFKQFTSEVMLLPALYCQAKTQQGIFKGDSFAKARTLAPGEHWEIMDQFSELRKNWDQRTAKASKTKLAQRWQPIRHFSERLHNELPATYKNWLDENRKKALLHLTDELSATLDQHQQSNKAEAITLAILLPKGEIPAYLETWIHLWTQHKRLNTQVYRIGKTKTKKEIIFEGANAKSKSLLSSKNYKGKVAGEWNSPEDMAGINADRVISFADAVSQAAFPTIQCDLIQDRFEIGSSIESALAHGEASLSFQVVYGEQRLLEKSAVKMLPYQYDQSLWHLLENIYQLLTKWILLGPERQTANLVPHALQTKGKRLSEFDYLLEKGKHYLHLLTQGDVWNIGIVNVPINELALTKDKNYQVNWFPELPGQSFNADPFGIQTETGSYVLYEHYDAGKSKGLIHIRNEKDGVVKTFETKVHLSYPYIFQNGENVYCIPEQCQSNKIDLYRFNFESGMLDFVKTILPGIAGVDVSVVQHDSKWWLFCNDAANKGADLALRVFYAERPEGDWMPHALNPVKTTISGSRPGGTMFHHNEKLYRPAQDSAKGYGAELIIYQVTKLNEKEFEEVEVNRLKPNQFGTRYSSGVHTISRFGNRCLIDGKRKKIKFIQ